MGSLVSKKTDNKQAIFVTHLNVRQSISMLLLRLIFIDFFAVSAFVAFHSVLFNTTVAQTLGFDYDFYSFIILMSLFVVKIVFTIYIVLQWLNEYYEIWPNYILHRKGIIWRKEEKYPFNQLRSIHLQQGIFGKLLNYGTLFFHDWYLDKDFMWYLVHNPNRYLKIIEQRLPKEAERKEILRGRLREDDD